LTDKGVQFESINYIDHPLSVDKLKQLLDNAGLKPEDAVRRGEDVYRQLVAGKNLNDSQLIHLMAAHPELIQRPIVVRGQKAVLARPVEKLADLDIK
jgi:arsenate reductase (glutaredoxin)